MFAPVLALHHCNRISAQLSVIICLQLEHTMKFEATKKFLLWSFRTWFKSCELGNGRSRYNPYEHWLLIISLILADLARKHLAADGGPEPQI